VPSEIGAAEGKLPPSVSISLVIVSPRFLGRFLRRYPDVVSSHAVFGYLLANASDGYFRVRTYRAFPASLCGINGIGG